VLPAGGGGGGTVIFIVLKHQTNEVFQSHGIKKP